MGGASGAAQSNFMTMEGMAKKLALCRQLPVQYTQARHCAAC